MSVSAVITAARRATSIHPVRSGAEASTRGSLQAAIDRLSGWLSCGRARSLTAAVILLLAMLAPTAVLASEGCQAMRAQPDWSLGVGDYADFEMNGGDVVAYSFTSSGGGAPVIFSPEESLIRIGEASGSGSVTYGAVGRLHINNSANQGRVDVTLTCTPPAPVISSQSSTTGSEGGGGEMRLQGTHFSGMSITMGGIAITPTLLNDYEVSFRIPPHAVGPVDLVLTNWGGSTTLGYTYGIGPVITTMSPDRGTTNGGQAVTIEGRNLQGASVQVGMTTVVPISNTATRLVFNTPASGDGPVEVRVIGGGGETSTVFIYLANPTAANISTTTPMNSAGVQIPLVISHHDSVSLVSGAAHGMATLSGTTVTYVPQTGFSGTDSFTYQSSSDVGVSRTATVTINVQRPPALSALTPSVGTFAPAFEGATDFYSITVAHDVTSVSFTPTLGLSWTGVTVAGTPVASGAASQPVPVNDLTDIVIQATADNGDVARYLVRVTRQPSPDATLSNLSLSGGVLEPGFAPGQRTYIVNVPAEVTQTTVTPTVNNSGATVTVNGASVVSGGNSARISLAAGPTVIIVRGRAPNGDTADYQVTVTRQASTDATLSHLALSSGAFSPSFQGNVASYAATVGREVETVTLTPTVNGLGATVTVNGSSVPSGVASQGVALNIGANPIEVAVTAEDGSILTYTMTVTRSTSADATLSHLALSNGALSPAFAAGTTSYTASVGNAVSTLTLTPTVNGPGASATVNGSAVASGASSQPVDLAVGETLIPVRVTAESGVVKAYSVTVTRAPSADASLSNLTLSAGALDPGFSPGVTGYSVTTPGTVTAISLTPTVNDPTATVRVNNTSIAPGAASPAIPLSLGVNTITVTVTAQSGAVRTYTVEVTRPLASDAALSSLYLWAELLIPGFNPDVTHYRATANALTPETSVNPTVRDPGARIEVNGQPVPSEGLYWFDLPVGDTTVTIRVIARDGTIRDYSVTVTRPPVPVVGTNLSALVVSDGTLNRTFEPFGFYYATTVGPDVSSIRVTATLADATSSLAVGGVPAVSGAPSEPVPLAYGENEILIGITTASGEYNDYVLTVTRLSNDNRLSALTTSQGALNPAFDQDTLAYAMTVPNTVTAFSLTPTVNQAGSAVTVNGVAVASGAASAPVALAVGQTVVPVQVTALTGLVRTYVVTVLREPRADASLSALSLSSGTLGPTFDASINRYAVSVDNAVDSLTVTAVTSQTDAILTVNETPATSGRASPSVNLPVGETVITVGVTARNGGATGTYTVTVTRNPPAPTEPPGPPVISDVTVQSGPEGTDIDLSGAVSGAYTSLALAAAPAHGRVTISGTTATYVPQAGYSGADRFTYVATGPGGVSAPAVVAVTVGLPPAPTAANVLDVVVPHGSGGTVIDLTASVAGASSGLAIATPPVHGTATLSGMVVTYVPAADHHGADSFTYVAMGPGGVSAPATVTLKVTSPPAPVIDKPIAPVVAPPATGGNRPVIIDLGSTTQGVIDGYRITATGRYGAAAIVGGVPSASGAPSATATKGGSTGPQATAGVFQLVYTPAANFMGTDMVTLVAHGPGGESTPVTFTFQVAGKAPDLSVATLSDRPVSISPAAGLIGGPFERLRVTSNPSFGAIAVQGLTIVFTPRSEGGSTVVDYVIDLPFGVSAPGRIELVSNLLPASDRLVAETLQGHPVTVRISNAAGGPFTSAAVVSTSPTLAGTATITGAGGVYDLTFTSSGDFSGEAVVRYSLTNAFGTVESTLTVTVDARPNPALDPEVRGVATSQVTSARRVIDAQIGNFQSRLRDLHDGVNRSSNGLGVNFGQGSDADRDPREALRRQLGQTDRLDPGALDDARTRDMLERDRWADRQVEETADPSIHRLGGTPAQGAGQTDASLAVWTSGSIDWGRQDADGVRDSRFTTQGVTAGLDVQISDRLIVGGGLGYGEDKTKIGENGSVSKGQALTGALYASWRPADAFYVDGVFGFADLDFDSRRWHQGLAGQSDGYVEGARAGDVRFASAAFGRLQRASGRLSDIYARLDAHTIVLDGFTETGAGLSSLVWDEIDQTSLSANLGASIRWDMQTRRYGRFSPSVRLEWSYEFENIGEQSVRYADWATSPIYLIPLNAWSRNALNLNLGMEWSVTERLEISLGYRGLFGDASSSNGGQLGLKYGW